jgi:polysaccharide biosynthesis/export protein
MIDNRFGVIKLIVFSFILSLPSAQNLLAQGLDQNIFDQIKQKTGATTDSTQVNSPLDQLREQDYLDKLNFELEERLRAGPSIVEQDYNSRQKNITKDKKSNLRQFGYNIFNRHPPQNQIMTGTVPDSYILGTGDELIVNFKGFKEGILSVKIDREGRLVIPSLLPLTASGLTLSEVRATMEKQVRDSLIGTEVFVSVATLRQISVLVAGEVEKPSLVRTTSLASPIEVLLHVGGIKKTGSLRNLILLRGNERIPVDLYSTIEGANSIIQNLMDGDRLIVPTIGATVALDGNVIRPGIYELPAGNTDILAKEALRLAGGAVRPNGNDFTHIQYDDMGRQTYEKLNLNGTVKSGEIVVVNLMENSQTGKVTLMGHIKTPGVRSYSAYNNVKDLIGSVNNLTEDPYLLFGVIERTDKLTQSRQLIPFSPQKVLFGDENVPLLDEDKVIIIGRNDVEFLTSDVIRQTIYTNEYLEAEFLADGRPNSLFCEPIKKLARIISDTQSDRFATAIRALFVRRESSKEQQRDRELILDNVEELALEQQRRQAVIGASNLSNQEALSAEKEREEKEKEAEKEEDYKNCPLVYQNVDDLLSFTLEHIISVDGAVRLPGVFPITKETGVDLLLSVSGGTSNDANMSRIEVTNYSEDSRDNNLVMNWEYVDGSVRDLNSVFVSPGGGVRVSSSYTNFESGAVLLSGEFMQPGVYTIRKGEKLSSLIQRAGGLSQQAYPYGAIFTRDRVREIQQQEMRQTSQRLQSALLSASVKQNVDAAGLVAIQRMVKEMATQDFVGRVVIEADPAVLNLEPSLDVVLEAGDSLFIPKRPNFIVTVGNVLNPSALQFVPGKGVEAYLKEVGGFARAADEDRVFVVYPNGVARPISLSSWGGDRNLSIPPGSAIVVPNDLSPYDNLTLVTAIGNIFQNFAVSAASIAVLLRN